MTMELAVQNYGGEIYEISDLVTSISWDDKLNDGCSILEISYLKNDKVTLKNGAFVRFKYDGHNVFFGRVFKRTASNESELTVTCYDQLRYAKAKDSYVIKKKKLNDVVNVMCTRLNLKAGKLPDTGYTIPASIQDNKAWLDIVYDCIGDTLFYKKRRYRLADEFGTIMLRDLMDLKTDLILGDGSLVYSYDYESSIEELYNYIKVVSDNKKTGKRDVYIAQDEGSMKKYGVLLYFDKLEDNVPKSQAKERTDALLKLYNREEETLSLECIGDCRIRAGVSFYIVIKDLGISYRVICKRAAHTYLPSHTMSLEVELA